MLAVCYAGAGLFLRSRPQSQTWHTLQLVVSLDIACGEIPCSFFVSYCCIVSTDLFHNLDILFKWFELIEI